VINLPRATPASQKIDANAIDAYITALEKHEEIEPHSLILIRHGQIVAEGEWSPYRADVPQLLHSLSKSFTSTAVGFAVQEGLVSLDDTVISYFPELDEEITDPGSRRILVRHALAMASGHLQDTYAQALLDPRGDVVRGFLLMPPDREPGTVFAYNQSCTYSLAAIVQKVSGASLIDFLRPRLFEPLGMGEPSWIADVTGRQLGFSGLHASTEAIALLGQLYLQRGEWEGQQLLSNDWVDEATSLQVATTAEQAADWALGYGFQFWMAKHGFRGDGAFGQFCIVLPEQDAVLAMTGQSINMHAVVELTWKHLFPGFDSGVGDDIALSERLAGLALAPLGASDGVAELLDQDFTPEGDEWPELQRIALRTDADGWALALHEGENVLRLRPTMGAWAVAEAIASSASVDPETIAVDLLFLETPHRLHLRCDRRASTFTATWETVPLHYRPMTEMRARSDYRAT
jgi:CubicO group peptidase (beta-lactamase class C family)